MKILFICHANVCRSFMAQEILKKLVPQAEVFSRGLYADPQLHIPGKVKAFLAKQQIIPNTHLSTQLTESDLAKADFVFCMEPQQLDFLSDRYAQYADKMWLVNEFAFGKETAIEDPISLSGRAFEKQAKLLQKAIEALAKKLTEQN